MNSSNEPDEQFRKYAWDYFAMHASQRLLGVQFFITLATAIIGGYFVLIAGSGQGWGAILGLLLVVLSFVFYKLDARTRALIKNAENALAYLDNLHFTPNSSGEPHPLQLIARDDYFFSNTKNTKHKGIFKAKLSYTKCFNIVFIVFAALGIGIFIQATLFAGTSKSDQKKSTVIRIDARQVTSSNESARGGSIHVQ